LEPDESLDTNSSIQVPEAYRSGLSAVAELDDEAVEALEAYISSAPPTLTGAQLLEGAHAAIPRVERPLLDSVLTALLSLFRASDDLQLSMEQVADQLSSSPDLSLDRVKRQVLRERIRRLTQSGTLSLTSKGLGLVTANERSFHSARIISDIRPVFRDDPSSKPDAAVLVHLLSISYHVASGELREVQVGLDQVDLNLLERIVERAKAKSRSLSAVLNQAGVTLLNPEREVANR
jgi:hypothetical protein